MRRDIIGEGLSWLIEIAEPDRALDEDEWYGDGQHAGISTAVHRTILDQGVLIPEFSGERLWIVPPLIISEDDLAGARRHSTTPSRSATRCSRPPARVAGE